MLPAMAAAATGVAGLVTATVVAAKVVAVGSVAVMGAMALSDAAEGVQEIAHGFKEDTQTESFNFARDLAFSGDEQNYATFQQGMMFLAMLQISFAQPYQQARQTASSANEKAMKENKSSQFSGNQMKGNKWENNGGANQPRFPDNPNELFPEDYPGMTKKVQPDGKIIYEVQSGGKIYKVEYHPSHGGVDHFDGNHYHVKKQSDFPPPGKSKPVDFRIPNLDPDTPAVSGGGTFAPGDLLPTQNKK